MNRLNKKISDIETLTNDLKVTKIHPKNINDSIKEALQVEELSVGMYLYDLLKRPQISINYLTEYLPHEFNKEILEIVETQVKYEGYIAKTNREVEKMLKLESKKIPKDIDYDKVKNIASEARQKLKLVKPETIAQATRISGVNPADIAILTVYLKKEYSRDINE